MNTKTLLKKTHPLFYIVFLFFYFSPFIAMASIPSKNFFLFVINGDSEKNDYYSSCKNNKTICATDQKIKKSFSLTLFDKAVKMSETCQNCDSLIVFVKPETHKKKMDSKSAFTNTDNEENIQHRPESTSMTSKRRVLLYQSGTKVAEEYYSSNANTNIFNFIPTLSTFKTLLFTYFSFEKEVELVKTVFSETQYHKQFAFYMGHKLPDTSEGGALFSEPLVRFGMSNLMQAFKKVSRALNQGDNRPFDALFLAQCASTIQTIHEVYKSDAASLVVGTPEVIPLTGLADWNLNHLEKKLQQQKPLKTILTSWLQDLFSTKPSVGISHKILTDYTLSLYDIKKIQSMDKVFSQTARTLNKRYQNIQSKEKTTSYNVSESVNWGAGPYYNWKDEQGEDLVDESYNWNGKNNENVKADENSEAIAQGHYRISNKAALKNLLFSNNETFKYDCYKDKSLHSFIKKAKENKVIFNLFQGGRSLLDLINGKSNQRKPLKKQNTSLHSGWGCQ